MTKSNIIPGLVSVTFRSLTAAQIVDLAGQAGLSAIEWGGDVHVPHGDLQAAAQVAAHTRDAGLTVTCYGSYYRAGAQPSPRFEDVLATAKALGSPLIRVWAGSAGSDQTTPEMFDVLAADLQRICHLAAGDGIDVATEFHGGTCCDTAESTLQLLTTVGAPNLRTLWQPNGPRDIERRLAEIDMLAPWLANVHVYQWDLPIRLPLAYGAAEWQSYLSRLANLNRPIGALLEFVANDSPEQLLADAATLLGWL